MKPLKAKILKKITYFLRKSFRGPKAWLSSYHRYLFIYSLYYKTVYKKVLFNVLPFCSCKEPVKSFVRMFRKMKISLYDNWTTAVWFWWIILTYKARGVRNDFFGYFGSKKSTVGYCMVLLGTTGYWGYWVIQGGTWGYWEVLGGPVGSWGVKGGTVG